MGYFEWLHKAVIIWIQLHGAFLNIAEMEGNTRLNPRERKIQLSSVMIGLSITDMNINWKDYRSIRKFRTEWNTNSAARYFIAFLIMLFITILCNLCNNEIVVWIFKIVVCVFEGIRWFRHLKEENKVKYFKPSLVCTVLNWLIIIVLLFLKIKWDVYLPLFVITFMIIAMILMFKGGHDYLKIINKYYPDVMREYNISSDALNIKMEKLEKRLLEIKENSSAIVVDAIMKRETAKLIWPFHEEMVFLIIMIFWGTGYID